MSVLDPQLAFKIQEIKAECERRRRIQCHRRFALTALALISGATLLLVLAPNPFQYILPLLTPLILLYLWRQWVHLPQKDPITERQVALLIDESYPELQNRIINMVDLETGDADLQKSYLVQTFLRESKLVIRRNGLVHQPLTQLDGGLGFLGALLMLTLGILLVYRQNWTPRLPLFLSGQQAETIFTVEPGDTRLRRGDDLNVFVKSDQIGHLVTISLRDPAQSIPMKTGETDHIHYHRFANVTADFQYRVHFGPWNSPWYKVTTWIPPEVTAIDLTYHPPPYLNLPPREAPNNGHVSAIENTRVDMRVAVNKSLITAVAKFDSGTTLALKPLDDLTWSGDFIATQKDRYQIVLTDQDNRESIFNPVWDVTVRADHPPEVRLLFPRNDMETTSLDEIPFQFGVMDDYGVVEFGIQYQIAGADPVLKTLSKGEPVPQAEGRFNLALEELNLSAGDLITWTVWARDAKPDRAEYQQLGDPYFLTIRPFKRFFQEAVSNEQGDNQNGESLAKKQKSLIIATWNLRRRQSDMTQDQYQTDHQTIVEGQNEILAALPEGGPLAPPAPGVDPEQLKSLRQAVDAAVSALESATGDNRDAGLAQAAVHQQEAYQMFVKMEPDRAQVQQSLASSENSGGDQTPGMDQLEMERNRNFYEEEKYARREQEAAGEALDKLKDLAERRRLINEEINRLLSENESPEDPEERKRRLERLREEAAKNIQELDQMQRNQSSDPNVQRTMQAGLDEARDHMEESLEHLEQNQLQQARNAGSRALENLDNIRTDLEQKALGSAQERMADLQEKMRDLQNRQQALRDSLEAAKEELEAPKLSDNASGTKQQLMQEKDAMAEAFRDMIEEAADIADLTRGNQKVLSRELGDWVRKTARDGIGEEIEDTNALMRYGALDDLQEKEAEIAAKLDKAAKGLEKTAQRVVGDELDARQKAVAELKPLLDQAAGGPGSMSAADMEAFGREGYRDWLNRIENTGDFMPEGPPADLNQVQRQIERMRRDYRQDGQPPEAQPFFENVVQPLHLLSQRLDREIQELKSQRDLSITNEDHIPDRYRKQVSDYFESLSQLEGGG